MINYDCKKCYSTSPTKHGNSVICNFSYHQTINLVLHSGESSWPHPPTLDKAGKACQGHSSLIRKSVNYGQKSFITLAPGVGKESDTNARFEPLTFCSTSASHQASLHYKCHLKVFQYFSNIISVCKNFGVAGGAKTFSRMTTAL